MFHPWRPDLPALFFIILVAAAISFYFGITEPLMLFQRFFFLEREASLIEIVRELWRGTSWPLAIVIGLFSIGLPVVKLVYLGLSGLLPAGAVQVRTLSFLSTISKWSMMDVLVVALVIVATKTTGLAKASTQPGLWFFTASVVLMAIATLLAPRLSRPAQ